MAAQFKADAVVQNYKMKESRDVIRAKAEIAIQKEMEKAAAKVAAGVTDAKEPEVPESEQQKLLNSKKKENDPNEAEDAIEIGNMDTTIAQDDL